MLRTRQSCTKMFQRFLTCEDKSALSRLVSGRSIDGNDDDAARYNTDWLRLHTGRASLILKPKTSEEVSKVLRYCDTRGLPVVPQGGNTGLVCGSTPLNDEIVLSMELMSRIHNFDPMTGTLHCGAGCVLATAEEHVGAHGFTMPLDLGAKGSCQIGGNVATNAGGIRFLKYGSLHGSVIGLKVVLADGTIVDSISALRKDNTGYHTYKLFIGSEGTLGVITEASIVCQPKPVYNIVALLACESYTHCCKVLSEVRRHIHEQLYAYEFFDAGCREVVTKRLRLSNPLSGASPFYVLIEVGGADLSLLRDQLSGAVERLGDLVSDGVLAEDDNQVGHIWKLREHIAEALLADGHCYKYDVSLASDQMYTVVEEVREHLNTTGVPYTRCVGYGHLGDGNLHLNVTSAAFDGRLLAAIEPFIYERVSVRGGSVSAEHGVGSKKVDYLHYSKSIEQITLMKRLKQLFDPNGILNPGKVFNID